MLLQRRRSGGSLHDDQHSLDLSEAEGRAEERLLLDVPRPQRSSQVIELLHSQRGQLTRK